VSARFSSCAGATLFWMWAEKHFGCDSPKMAVSASSSLVRLPHRARYAACGQHAERSAACRLITTSCSGRIGARGFRTMRTITSGPSSATWLAWSMPPEPSDTATPAAPHTWQRVDPTGLSRRNRPARARPSRHSFNVRLRRTPGRTGSRGAGRLGPRGEPPSMPARSGPTARKTRSGGRRRRD
jgi:hypothetical protein